MSNDTYQTEELSREIKRLRSTQPHLENLLNAFEPLILEKNKWLTETVAEPRILAIDPLRYAEGISLNRQHLFFLAEDPWGSAGFSAVKAIIQGFPLLNEDMEVLLSKYANGNSESFCQFFANTEENERPLSERAVELGISPDSLHLFLRVLNRFMLTKKAMDVKTQLAALVWRKGYCPVCGSFPHLAIIGEMGQRLLHCSECGHAWPFARLACPYCEHEDPQSTNIFFIDGQQEDTAFTCDKCHRYLLSATRSASLGHSHADIIAMGLIHLDIILQEKGYKPMAECDWNSIETPEG